MYHPAGNFKDDLGIYTIIQRILKKSDRLGHISIQYYCYHACRALPKVCRSGLGRAMAERATVARALIPDGGFTARQPAPVAGKA